MSTTQTKIMTREEILDTIKSLSHSQGFYQRIYDAMEELKQNDPEQYELFMKNLEAQDFKDEVDLVLFFEM